MTVQSLGILFRYSLGS